MSDRGERVVGISISNTALLPFMDFEILWKKLVNPKRFGGKDQFDLHPCGFFKTVSSKDRMEPCFFVTLNF